MSKVKGNVFNQIFASVLMAGLENHVIYQSHQRPGAQPQPQQQQQPQPQPLTINVRGMETVLGMDIVTFQQEFVLVQ